MQSQSLALRRPLPGARRRAGRQGRGGPDALAALRGLDKITQNGKTYILFQMIADDYIYILFLYIYDYRSFLDDSLDDLLDDFLDDYR
jgi:hypothetical protein